MGFFQKVGNSVRKIGQKAVSTSLKLGNKVLNFVEKKAIPLAGKIVSGVETGIKVVSPLIASVVPEALPLLMGANKGLGLLRSGIDEVGKGVMFGKKLVEKGEMNNPFRK